MPAGGQQFRRSGVAVARDEASSPTERRQQRRQRLSSLQRSFNGSGSRLLRCPTADRRRCPVRLKVASVRPDGLGLAA